MISKDKCFQTKKNESLLVRNSIFLRLLRQRLKIKIMKTWYSFRD